jgi:hypothetical protein
MPGLLRGIARTAIVAGTATAVSNRVSRRQAGRWAQQDQPRYSSPQAPAADDEAAMRLSQLRDLGDLRSQGILSEEEFIQQKEWILNQ